MKRRYLLEDEAATLALAARYAQVLATGGVVYLEGDLGMGKTTFARGILRALGHEGPVKSPTYTLVEPYVLPQLAVYHFDLYRLTDAEEMEYLGAREYFTPSSLCLVEWPGRGAGWLPPADMRVAIQPQAGGREVCVEALSARLQHRLSNLQI